MLRVITFNTCFNIGLIIFSSGLSIRTSDIVTSYSDALSMGTVLKDVYTYVETRVTISVFFCMRNRMILKFSHNTKHQLHCWRTVIIWRKAKRCVLSGLKLLLFATTSHFWIFFKYFLKVLFNLIKHFFWYIWSQTVFTPTLLWTFYDVWLLFDFLFYFHTWRNLKNVYIW